MNQFVSRAGLPPGKKNFLNKELPTSPRSTIATNSATANLIDFDPVGYLSGLENLPVEKIDTTVSQLNGAQCLGLNKATFAKYRKVELSPQIAMTLLVLENLRKTRSYSFQEYSGSRIMTPNFLGQPTISNKSYYEWEDRR